MTDPTVQDRDFGHLHPLLRHQLLEFFQETGRRKLAVFVTEGWRSEERQGWLYASGRSRSGPILTHALPGQSYHNLLLAGRKCSAAVDVAVWDEDKPWPKSLEWQGSDKEWQIVEAAADKAGLQTLSFERPHLQLPFPLPELARGLHWPEGVTPWLTTSPQVPAR